MSKDKSTNLTVLVLGAVLVVMSITVLNDILTMMIGLIAVLYAVTDFLRPDKEDK